MKQIKIFFLTTFLSTLLMINARSQSPVKNYDPQWKKVEAFQKKGLPKSALAEVEKIYEAARKDKQDAQIIKCLVYRTGLQAENREENQLVSLKEIEAEIITAKEPARSILKSLAAEKYWDYFQENRWKFYDRTPVAGTGKEDIATWTLEDLHQKISSLYLSSIGGENLLKQTRLEFFDAILVKGNTRKLRPTLFDLLAHRALDYFKNDERDIRRPAYAFEINQAAAFDPAPAFVKQKFITNDSSSFHHKALLIFQDLLAFHLQQKNTEALLDADIERLEFVRQFSVHPDKEDLYLKALVQLTSSAPASAAIDQAWYLQAQYYENLAASYKPYGDTTHRYDRALAKSICEKVLARKEDNSAAPLSEGAVNCYNLLLRINRRVLDFRIEKVNVPGQPFRALIGYRNIHRLHLRILKTTEKIKQLLEKRDMEEYWSSLATMVPLKSWEQELPVTTDLQEHRVEIKLEALPAGEYILIAGTEKDFQNKNIVGGARLFYVSTISYVNSGNNFFVLDRDNGQPLARAAVQLWEQKYDSKKSQFVKEKTNSYQTDANGFFMLKKTRDGVYNNDYLLEIDYKGEKLFLDDFLYNYYYERGPEPEKKETITTWLFTDRGIYRPGQTIYFKGIVSSHDNTNGKSSVRENYDTKIYLKGATDEVLDSLPVKTNEFGSFSGKFQLGPGKLTGGYSLYMKNNEGSANLQVEEYKRPKFYVDFEKIRGSYTVGDSIRITGTARAYAGNNIDKAHVKFRVVREPRFLYPWLFRKWWQPPSEEMEIAHGDLQTDGEGKFNIVFTAIPDRGIEKKFDPVFDFKVYADVTDLNGETRSGETAVSVSYKSLILQVSLPASLPADSLASIAIRTENMNGSFEPAVVNLTISRLQEEKRLIRNRYWERPDLFSMNRDEYINNFPHDEYNNETDAESWEKGETVFEKRDSVRENAGIQVGSWPSRPGFYRVEIVTKDQQGREIKDERFIELYNQKNPQLARPQYLWTESARPIEPGEKTAVTLGSSADNLFVIQETRRPSRDKFTNPSNAGEALPGFNFLKLNNEKKSYVITATEADRGGYGLNYLFVKHNRFYLSVQPINVPWSNKDLKIEYASFRDKTLPGSQEKWKLKISGSKNEKIAAEMLASMYDASLDQFYPFDWNKPYLWPLYYNNNSWNGNQNFSLIRSQENWFPDEPGKSYSKEYDYLITETVQDGYHKGPLRLQMAYKTVVASASRVGNKEGEGMKADTMAVYNLNDPTKTEKYVVNVNEPEATTASTKRIDNSPVQVRKNFNETAFFFPDLRTDSSGSVEFSFTLPDALTRWKFQTLVHSKELAFGLSSREIVTQKQLMVQPNPPRFLREGDRMEFSVKIANLSSRELTGQAELQLFDAATNQSVDGWFQNMFPNQFFTVAAAQSEVVTFPVQVPYLFNKALTWRVVAKTQAPKNGTGLEEILSDGEESSLPVLTNKMLVTESLPLNMRGNGPKDFAFEKLQHTGASETLQHHSLTVEFTTNPAWYAVQALPYLIEYPYECAEQTWNRYYANSLATLVANASPRLRNVFEKWKTTDTSALASNLEKNPELKSILLEETPWVLEAKSEDQQKKNIGLLFDLVRMSGELNSALEKLKEMQLDNGGFVWFRGGPDDRYMTQYILTGIGHLKKLNGFARGQEAKLKQVIANVIPYLDKKIKEDYADLIKHKTNLKTYTPGPAIVQYLYMRSFFPEYRVAVAFQPAYNFFKERAQKSWTLQNKYLQGMLALALSRAGDSKNPLAILKSLKETSLVNEELGRYWKNQRNGWYWYESPVETQALLIEAFDEAGKDTKTADELKTWLLKNKQTNNWRTTKATAEACYALLLRGSAWISQEPVALIRLGNLQLSSADEKQEAGTGYFKKTIPGEKVNPDMGSISVKLLPETSPSAGTGENLVTWGAVYWQYFENLDKITTASTNLNLSKKLFVEKNTDRGPVLVPVNDGDVIKVGDKIIVRIVLKSDRDMEYVHMKDMRASSLEPLNVLSGYNWKDGLGYYESTRDASTNFFFGRLDKGTHVFEYSLFATHKGNFSNGITSIQCMYAPEFASHSEGIRISVE